MSTCLGKAKSCAELMSWEVLAATCASGSADLPTGTVMGEELEFQEPGGNNCMVPNRVLVTDYTWASPAVEAQV